MLAAFLLGAMNGMLLASIGWEIARQRREANTRECICQHIPAGHKLRLETS